MGSTSAPYPEHSIILSGNAHPVFAQQLGRETGIPLGNVAIRTFSDQETHVTIEEDVSGLHVYIVQPTSMPANDHLMELLMIAHAAQAMGAQHITAVMPFFGYRRQEKQLENGEIISFELMAKLLKTAGIDRVMTIDLHKHRSSEYFTQAGMKSIELRAFETILAYLKTKALENIVVLAPDKGSIPESEKYATALNVPLVKVTKTRDPEKMDEVTIETFEGNVAGRDVLIIDDEINTAGTLVGVVDVLKKKKAGNIYFACTHAVLSGPAIERLEQSPLEEIIVTDTIAIPPNKQLQKMTQLSVVPLFAETITG